MQCLQISCILQNKLEETLVPVIRTSWWGVTVHFLRLTLVMEFQRITHKVSFIVHVELQPATLLYNSIMGYDLLNGNSYA